MSTSAPRRRRAAAAWRPLLLAPPSLLLLCIPHAAPLPAYRDLIPNGMRVPGVDAPGHNNKGGGGALNAFGRDFSKAGHRWSMELCHKDSDGDGYSNGAELGDACCRWQEGLPEKVLRLIFLSNPGNNCSTPTDPHGYGCRGFDEEGWNIAEHMDVSRPDSNDSADVGLNASAKVQRLVRNCSGDWRGGKDFWAFYYGHSAKIGDEDWSWGEWGRLVAMPFHSPVVSYRWLRGGALKSAASVFMVAVAGVLATTVLWKGDLLRLTARQHAVALVAALLWLDGCSGILHVVLDNPRFNTWPVVGPIARDFQGHHDNPGALTRKGWPIFLAEIHLPAMFISIMNVGSCMRAGPVGRVFFMWLVVHIHTVMAAHRWSHRAPFRNPGWVRGLQNWGVLVTPEHHSAHHATYDVNFSILGGWTNPFINFVCNNFIHPQAMVFLPIFAAYCCTPMLYFTFLRPHKEAVMERVKLLFTERVGVTHDADGRWQVPPQAYTAMLVAGVLATLWALGAGTSAALHGSGGAAAAHPPLMAAAFLILLPLGWAELRSPGLEMEARRRRHRAAMGGAVACAGAGLTVAVAGFGAPRSAHSILGVAVLTAMCANATSGLLGWKWYPHRAAGRYVIPAGVTAAALGIARLPPMVPTTCVYSALPLIAVVGLAALTLMSRAPRKLQPASVVLPSALSAPDV